VTYGSPDDMARERAARNATTQYRPLTDESEAVSGDGIVYADESEYIDNEDDESDPIAELRAEFAEAHADGASSNDIAQLLDDWLVKHGQPTVLYA
jgi:hypothetical protein